MNTCYAEASSRDAPSIELPHQHAEEVGHIALDIGGSLIKLVYFSSVESSTESMPLGLGTPNQPHTGGDYPLLSTTQSQMVYPAFFAPWALDLQLLHLQSHCMSAARKKLHCFSLRS